MTSRCRFAWTQRWIRVRPEIICRLNKSVAGMNAPLTGGFHERVVQHQNASLRPRNKRGELGPNSLERLTKGVRLSYVFPPCHPCQFAAWSKRCGRRFSSHRLMRNIWAGILGQKKRWVKTQRTYTSDCRPLFLTGAYWRSYSDLWWRRLLHIT